MKAKVFTTALLAAFALFISVPDAKADMPWQPVSFQGWFDATVCQLKPEKANLRFTGNIFSVPENDLNQVVLYLGPLITLNETTKLALHAGYGYAAAPGPNAKFVLGSVWLFKDFTPKVSSFFESDVNRYTEGSEWFYYGYYTVDRNFPDTGTAKWNLGIQGEQLDKGIMFGPHAGVNIRKLHLELQYYAGLQDANKGHTCRLMGILFLP